MADKVIKFKNLDVQVFLDFLKKINIGDVPYIVEIEKNLIFSKSRGPLGNICKYTSNETKGLIDWVDGEFSRIQAILKNSVDIKDLKNFETSLKFFLKNGDGKVSGSFKCKETETSSLFEIGDIDLHSLDNKRKIKIKCRERYFIDEKAYVKDEVWAKFGNSSDYILKFGVDSLLISNLKQCISIGGTDKNILLHFVGGKIHFRSSKNDGSWSLEYDGKIEKTTEEEKKFYLPSTIFDFLDSNLYEFYLKYSEEYKVWYILCVEDERNMTTITLGLNNN